MQTTRGLDRLVFFTDAVAAIAITLPLVNSVAKATHGPGPFIADNISQIGAFLLSFIVVARLWMTHHAIFEHVKSYTRSLLLLNLVWAFTIVVLPLPTEMAAQFASTPLTVSIYIGTMTVSSVALTAMVLLIRDHPTIELDENAVSRRTLHNSVVTTIGFFVALILGAFVPGVGFYALLLLLLSGPLVLFYDKRASAAHTSKTAR